MLDFWATWCAPCLTQMPYHQTLQERYADRRFHVIGIAIWSDKGPMTPEKALERHPGLSYSVAKDVAKATADIFMEGTKTKGLPTFMLIDRAGRLVWVGSPGEEFEVAMESVLADSFDLDTARRRDELRRKSEGLFAEIDELRRSGQPDLAVAKVDDVIALDEERNGWAYAMKYEIVVAELGDADLAGQVAQAFLSSEPGKKAFYNYVFALRMVRAMEQFPSPLWDLDIGLQLARRAVELADTPNPDYFAMLAQVHFQRKERAEAIQWQSKAVEAAPSAERKALAETLQKYESTE
jgi:thiol-disulfide isomerase/thioredoxin